MTNATLSFSFAFSFTTREEYVAERAAWKANYKALSTAQRQAKIALKKAFRDHAYSAANSFIGEIASNKALARDLIEMLAKAKTEAQRQYLASKAEKLAA